MLTHLVNNLNRGEGWNDRNGPANRFNGHFLTTRETINGGREIEPIVGNEIGDRNSKRGIAKSDSQDNDTPKVTGEG